LLSGFSRVLTLCWLAQRREFFAVLLFDSDGQEQISKHWPKPTRRATPIERQAHGGLSRPVFRRVLAAKISWSLSPLHANAFGPQASIDTFSIALHQVRVRSQCYLLSVMLSGMICSKQQRQPQWSPSETSRLAAQKSPMFVAYPGIRLCLLATLFVIFGSMSWESSTPTWSRGEEFLEWRRGGSGAACIQCRVLLPVWSKWDYYLNTLNGDVYTKTVRLERLWPISRGTGSQRTTDERHERNQRGSGSVWYEGAGAPGLAWVNGDYYLNTTNDDVYTKTGALGSAVANIKGHRSQRTTDERHERNQRGSGSVCTKVRRSRCGTGILETSISYD